MAYDTISASAKKGFPVTWCKKYGLNQMVSFNFNAHGEAAAGEMALEWSNRMQYFFSVWKGLGVRDYVYPNDDLNGYEPRQSYVEFRGAVPFQSRTWARIEAIDSMRPC